MLLQPHIRLLRTRLIVAAVCTLVAVLAVYIVVVAGDGPSLGIFWHTACTCPVDPDDVGILLSSGLVFALIACVLGFMGGYTPNLAASLRFTLTRPQSRLDVVLVPTLIAATAIALLPGAVWLLLLGWLTLVHAPALGHLVAVLETIPDASNLGPHPSLLALASAAHFVRIYLAGISIALCIYLFLHSGRWLMQSRFTTVKLIGVLSSALVFAGPFVMRFLPRSWLFLPPKDGPVNFAPSIFSIALHFAFAAAWFYATLWTIRDAEL